MRSTVILFLLSTFFLFGFYSYQTTQDPPALSVSDIADNITPELLFSHLSILASDSLQGRGTGQVGIDMAADYLARSYEMAGLTAIGNDGTWFQHFDLMGTRMDSFSYALFDTAEVSPAAVWSQVVHQGDESEFLVMFGGTNPASGDIIFIGMGLAGEEGFVDELGNVIDVRGQFVMMFREMPADIEADEQLETRLNGRLQQLLFRSGAAGIMLIDEMDQEFFIEDSVGMNSLIGVPSSIRLPDGGGRGGLAATVVSVSPQMVKRILGGVDSLNEIHTESGNELAGFNSFHTGYSFSFTPDGGERTLPSKNVVAFLEGCHEELKDEVVVISSHYDHMGIGQPDASGDMIYNGADDNGSGTVATLSIAEVMAQAKRDGFCLDRSVLFINVTAEEHGLLGSRYYSDNPIFPIENTVANFNLDMVGRTDYNYADSDEEYIYIIGAEIISSGLDSLLHVANANSVNLTLDMRYNDLDDRNQFYRRSDHWNFGRLGIPFIFFFSGVHEDYHQPSDTYDKIPFELYAKRVQLMLHTLVEVANSTERPEVDNRLFIERTQLGR